ncbi:MAG: IS1595 family transposase [Bauldia sp.]|nr:IS1595 family transposase [Bauldia sp.]
MAQQFLLSAAARTLSLSAIARMSDEEARAAFQRIRWAENGGEPYCPRCGCLKVGRIATRPVWKCGDCRYQFSVTAGTIFENRKRPIRDYLLAIAIFVNGAKGHSALQLSRDLDCQYKTAFVLAHKLREAIAAEQAGHQLAGTVEIDGAYFAGHRKPANKAADRIDRRLAEEQTGKRKVVVVLRQRGGRTLAFVTRKESDGVAIVRQRVAMGSTLQADEASGWDTLYAHYDMKRVNHRVEYKAADGANTNQAESYFSRLRRAEIGVHHRIGARHLLQYAREMAWREDRRRVSNGGQANEVAALALGHPVSREWAGYWQRSFPKQAAE